MSRLNEVVDNLVEAIYKLEIKKIDSEFIQLLNELEASIEENPQINWNDVLMRLQEAYMNKNYVALADIILYEIKKNIQ